MAMQGNASVLPLWPEGVPGSQGSAPADIPDITVYPAPKEIATGAAVVICPGGGYGTLCSSYEGHDIAAWLNSHGVAGIVLKNRVSPYRHPLPLMDAKRAMRIVRMNAQDWGIDPTRVGVMGFSAGGHLAATLGTHFDAGDPKAALEVERCSSRPDFMALVYPVISMSSKFHMGSVNNLLGENASDAARAEVSNELHVTPETPKAFIAHSVADAMVPVENSRMFADALKANGVPFEYLELPRGAHGLGCGSSPEWELWQTACMIWLCFNGLAR